jgi:hypothetical protein
MSGRRISQRVIQRLRRLDRYADLAAELVRLAVDVLVSQPAIAAAKEGTKTFPS